MAPVVLFERAGSRAASLAAEVQPEQLALPTPCTEWDVAALVAHMQGGAGYLLGALGLEAGSDTGYGAAVERCVRRVADAGRPRSDMHVPGRFRVVGRPRRPRARRWTSSCTPGTWRSRSAATASWTASWSRQSWPCSFRGMPDIGRKAGIVGPEVPVARTRLPRIGCSARWVGVRDGRAAARRGGAGHGTPGPAGHAAPPATRNAARPISRRRPACRRRRPALISSCCATQG